jgi:hypothetical protein
MNYRFTADAQALIRQYVDTYDGYPTSAHILKEALGIDEASQNDWLKKVLAQCMRESGWIQIRRVLEGGVQSRCWRRLNAAPPRCKWIEPIE